MSFTNELSIIPTSKEGVELAANQLLNDLDAGLIDPLLLKSRFKYLENIVKAIKPKLDEMAVIEARKYGDKPFGYMGFKVRVAEFGTEYDYTNCGDPVFNQLAKNIKELTEKRKEREARLKLIKQGETDIYTDPDTGEVTTLYPPLKTSTTSVEFKL